MMDDIPKMPDGNTAALNEYELRQAEADTLSTVMAYGKMMDTVLDTIMPIKTLPALTACPYCGGPRHTFFRTAWGVSCNAARMDNEECAGYSDEGYFTTELAAIEAHNKRPCNHEESVET
jgi:hypothetical protein